MELLHLIHEPEFILIHGDAGTEAGHIGRAALVASGRGHAEWGWTSGRRCSKPQTAEPPAMMSSMDGRDRCGGKRRRLRDEGSSEPEFAA